MSKIATAPPSDRVDSPAHGRARCARCATATRTRRGKPAWGSSFHAAVANLVRVAFSPESRLEHPFKRVPGSPDTPPAVLEDALGVAHNFTPSKSRRYTGRVRRGRDQPDMPARSQLRLPRFFYVGLVRGREQKHQRSHIEVGCGGHHGRSRVRPWLDDRITHSSLGSLREAANRSPTERSVSEAPRGRRRRLPARHQVLTLTADTPGRHASDSTPDRTGRWRRPTTRASQVQTHP